MSWVIAIAAVLAFPAFMLWWINHCDTIGVEKSFWRRRREAKRR